MIEYITKENKVVHAVPEEAFATAKSLLKGWKKEAEFKKELAIADHDGLTEEIKRREEMTLNFALQVIEMLEKYGEEAEEIEGANICSQ